MRYRKVYIDAIGYELAPVVVTSEELEARLAPVYSALRIPRGQLEAWTGIYERRWWEPGYPVGLGAAVAARHALAKSTVKPEDLDVVIYAAVCRELHEPATACRVAAEIGVSGNTAVFDICNACLGVLNGVIEVANRIELGQARAGLVVACETSRDIVETMMEELQNVSDMELFRETLATLTGGSGAAAVLVTDGSFESASKHRLIGGMEQAAPRFHELCRWGMELVDPTTRRFRQFMATDSVGVLKNGLDLGLRTWQAFLNHLGWTADQVQKTICHQVGAPHREAMLQLFGISPEKDFISYEFLGNMGTVSLPLTTALADERGFLEQGDKVGLLGIGSGLNCLMLGLEW